MRSETLSLVRVFDARSIRGTYSLSMGDNLNTSLKNAVKFLPNLNCILIDGHEDLDPSESLAEVGHQIQLLSMAGCPVSLSVKFINTLRGIVYLDISYVLGSLRPLFQDDELPELRVLKIQGKEVDDTTVENLTARFGTRLWSLDLSNNKLTDQALDSIGAHCLWPVDLRSDANFDVEGKLEFGCTTPDFGTWIRIVESEWSVSFSHPNRHFVDAPLYDLHDTLPQEFVSKRLDGKFPVKSDAADAVCRGLQGKDPYFPPASFQASQGLTHLNVSGNRISSLGVMKLLSLSRGRLEQFSCDSMMLVPPLKETMAAVWWPKTTKLYGFYATHTIRPVLSSNLRVVKLHHSVVTQIPTLELEGLSSMACLHIAENSLLPRAEMAFPEPFVPDMNPRITSLTITQIPRRSSGPLINRLISFLKLLSAQERALFDLLSRRGPSVLAGLRHFRLEFEQEAYEDGVSIAGEIDAEELLNSGDKGFSFFDDEARGRPQPVRELAASPQRRDLTEFPVFQREQDLETENLDIAVWVDGKSTRVKVWVGSASNESSNPMLRDYRELALHYKVHDRIGPASPAQIRAGVPSSALVFHTAWCMAIMPCRHRSDIKEPTRVELDAMKDVLSELKQFRLQGRAKYLKLQSQSGNGTCPPGPPHGFWLGKLEVSTHQRTLRSKTADYWR
jgi:Leucine-rich repeat (LRR) protein